MEIKKKTMIVEPLHTGTLAYLNKANVSSAAVRNIPECSPKSGLLLPYTWRSVRGMWSCLTEHCYWPDPVPCSSPTSLPLRSSCIHEGCSSNYVSRRMYHNCYQKAWNVCWKLPRRSKVLISSITHIQRWMLPHSVKAGSPMQFLHYQSTRRCQ